MSAIGRAFDIIEAVVAKQPSGLSFSGVVAATDAPKASAHRLLKELVEIGVLTFEPETARYRGSLKLAALGSEVIAHFDLRALVHPHLQALHTATRHTANLGIRDGDAGIFLDKIEAQDYGIKLFSAVGKRFPLHCTGMGKILLAFAHPEETRRILAQPLESYTSATITDPDELRGELDKVRAQGYALDREEITRGVVCVAAPVFGSGNVVVGAVSVAFPSYVMSDRGIEAEIRAVLKQSSAMSGALAQGQRGKNDPG